MLTPYLKFFNF